MMRANNFPKNYQNATDALHELQQATTLKVSIGMSREGNVAAARPSAAGKGLSAVVIYLKNLFGFQSAKERAEITAATATIINKMKVEAHLLVSEKISEIYDIHRAKTEFPLAKDSHHLAETKHAMATAVQGIHKELKEIEKSIKHGNFNKALERWKTLRDSVENKSAEKSRELQIKLCDDKQGPAATAPLLPQTEKNLSDEATERIASANRSLPVAMPEIRRTGEITRCSLSVPEQAQMNMLAGWQQWETHEKHSKEEKEDLFVGLADQFYCDADRITYVFDNDDFPIECLKDKDSVALGFKAALNNNTQRMKMLSHAVTQTAFNYIQDTAQSIHTGRNGMPFILAAGSGTEFTEHRIHMTAEKNGDITVDYLSFSKGRYLDSDIGTLEINRSEKFRGQPGRENAGICRSMKIRFKNEDLNHGQLHYKILEPLQLTLQVELPDSESGE